MPKPRKAVPVPPNGFVASAVRLPAVRAHVVGSAQGWQAKSWHFFNTLGEVRFIANWVGNMLSRATLVVARQEGQEYIPVDSGPAADVLAAYYGGRAGQTDMLQATGVDHTVAGECYHACIGKDEQWMTLADSKVGQINDQVYAVVHGERVPLAKNDYIARVWTPHPVEIEEADSPMRANLATLAELQQINAHVLSQLNSRLKGAGILFLPSEIQFASSDALDPAANTADAFMTVLGEVMSMAIKDPASAAAAVPLVVTAPGEYLSAVQQMNFWTPLDEATIAMRSDAVKRLALGMDTPPEVMLGMGDANHWNSWLVSEEAIKSHLEPRLQVIVNAITTAYLRPALEGIVPDPENYVVLADTSKIRMRPNRSSEAIELYDRGELSGHALRRETGFDTGDELTFDEFVQWLYKKVATGSTSPEQTQAALSRLGAELGMASAQDRNAPPPDDIRIDARREVTDRREPDPQRGMDEKVARDIGLAAACEVLVQRALERAGHRLANLRTRTESASVPAHERHLVISGSPDKLLHGTWEFAEQVLANYCDSPQSVISVLDLYCRGLLSAQIPHDPKCLAAALRQVELMS